MTFRTFDNKNNVQPKLAETAVEHTEHMQSMDLSAVGRALRTLDFEAMRVEPNGRDPIEARKALRLV